MINLAKNAKFPTKGYNETKDIQIADKIFLSTILNVLIPHTKRNNT